VFKFLYERVKERERIIKFLFYQVYERRSSEAAAANVHIFMVMNLATNKRREREREKIIKFYYNGSIIFNDAPSCSI
jgi:hypothetical protein